MKRRYFILIIIGIIFFSILPVVFILNINFIIYLIKWEKTDTITLLTSSILPFILAALTALFGNNTINAYNLLMIKSIKRNNSLMKLFEILMQYIDRFANEEDLKEIVELWRKNTRMSIQFSNSEEFRKFSFNKIIEFINNIKETPSIEYHLSHLCI